MDYNGRMKRTAWSFFEDVLFPPRCAGCGGETETNRFPLCSSCNRALARNDSFFCPVCRNRIPYRGNACHESAGYAFGAAVDFNDPAAHRIIHALKYENRQYAAIPMGATIAEYVSATASFDPEDADAVVPVPIHGKKLAERGYNQSFLIAKSFARNAGIPSEKVLCRAVVKSRETRSQTLCVTVKERRENVRGSFSVASPEKIRDKNIIIIDDVYTTGATAEELAKTLKRCGAKTVLALTFAKT